MTTKAETRSVTNGVALIALFVSAIAMGISPLFVRLADVGPFSSAFWRVFLALPALYVWARAASNADDADTKGSLFRPSKMVAIAGLFFAGDLIFWHLSIVHTTVANATFMATMAPLWVLLLSGIVLKEVVPKTMWIGLLFCLAGGAALIGSSVTLDPSRLVGDFYGLITSLFFAGYFLTMRIARRDTNSGTAIFASTLVTSAFLLVVALIMEGNVLPQSSAGWATLIALALISHAGGQGLLALALGYLPAGFSALVIFMEALAAAFAGWLFLSEALSPLQWLGGALIFAGIAYARFKKVQ